MKSERILGIFTGHVVRFVRVSQGFVKLERKVSFFEPNFQRILSGRKDERVEFNQTPFLSA